MKIITRFIPIACLFFLALGCDKSSPTPNIPDKISILKVTPTTGLADGQSTSFSVTVGYSLYSKSTGTLMIGFNNGQAVGSAVMITSANKIINSGSGEATFDVSATVKNWGTQGDFVVYVNLSEDPIPKPSWTPFATNHMVLIPKQ